MSKKKALKPKPETQAGHRLHEKAEILARFDFPSGPWSPTDYARTLCRESRSARCVALVI